MRTTPLLAAGVLASLAFAVAPPTTAPDLATVPYMATDQAGDANALNDQGLPFVAGTATGTSTPAQLDSADIRGARITSLYETTIGEDGLADHVMTGLQFRTGMTAEPTAVSAPLIHRFRGNMGGCTAWVQVATGAAGGQTHGTASVRILGQGCGVPDGAGGLQGSKTLQGKGISYAWDAVHKEMVVTVDLTTVTKELSNYVRRGDFYILDALENRHYSAAGITAPVIDMTTGSGFAVIGGDIPPDETA